MISTHTPETVARSARLGLRATPIQEHLLKQAAAIRHQSLTDFILDSACSAAEQTLLEQRLFMVSGQEYQQLLAMLDESPQENNGLEQLFARQSPWDKS